MTPGDEDDLREALGAYLLGHLEPDEEARVRAALQRSPELRAEEAELRVVASALPAVDPTYLDAEPAAPPELVERVSEAVRRDGRARPHRWVVGAAAAALVVAAVVGATQLVTEPEPGLGVEEEIAFAVEPAELDVEASVVPHTWGTEVFLEMTGLADGEHYAIDLVGHDGERVSAGTFIGDADLPVVCVMNGALLREEVDTIEITDADGQLVMASDLPPR